MRPSGFLLLILAAAPAAPQTLSADLLKPRKVKVENVTFKGKQAVRVTEAVNKPGEGDEDRIAVIPGSDLQNGTIEIELAGEPGAGAAAAARGFTGVAFRVAPDQSRFECFYLRPTNGRAEDQVRRNHSAQYTSFPEFPWYRLRKEFPEKYESYVDLAPGEWTRVKIEVDGQKARLYVHGAAQPALIVNDLKLAPAAGAVALWIGPGTVAHFANLKLGRQ
ncbi:MAG: hypothetical protein ACE15B_23370 [Bryobacteraceae bacterium]